MQPMTLEQIRAVVRSLRPIEKNLLLERLVKELHEIQPELVYFSIADIVGYRTA